MKRLTGKRESLLLAPAEFGETNSMIYKLNPSNIETLKNLPETGMGYQLIEASSDFTYITKNLMVINGKIAIEIRSLKYQKIIEAITKNNIEDVLTTSKEIQLNDIRIVPFEKSIGNFVNEDGIEMKKGAKDGKVENANGDELFVRLSAFEDDIRIDKINRCLRAGSFTTTASDSLKCKVEKNDPVHRYALPNELKIKWAFYIEPHPSDTLKRGFVQPAFERSGWRKGSIL